MFLRDTTTRSITIAALVGAAVFLTGCTGSGPAEPMSSPTPTPEPFVLAIGDCIASAETGPTPAPSATSAPSAPIGSLPVVDCAEPHGSEVFAGFDLPEGPFPGDALIIDAANDGCLAEFEAFIGLPAFESELVVQSVYPTQNSWLAGDREVLCLVSDPEAESTGSLFGAQR